MEDRWKISDGIVRIPKEKAKRLFSAWFNLADSRVTPETNGEISIHNQRCVIALQLYFRNSML